MDQPLHVLAVLGIIMIGKTIAAMALVLFFRYPINTALPSVLLWHKSVNSLYSGRAWRITKSIVTRWAKPDSGGALISITLNSFIFSAVEPVQNGFANVRLARLLERSGDPLAMLPDEVSQDYLRDQVVIVGHGEVGRRITLSLMEQNIKVVIAEENREIVENLRKKALQQFLVSQLNRCADSGSHSACTSIGDLTDGYY